MGDLLKGAGDIVDPMTGRPNPLGLILPQVRENNRLKRSMMQSELESEQVRRESVRFATDELVLESGDVERVKARRRGILLEGRESGLADPEAYRQVRARGFGKLAIEDVSERKRMHLDAITELQAIQEKHGEDMSSLIALMRDEDLTKAALGKIEHLDKIRYLIKSDDINRDFAGWKDNLQRELLVTRAERRMTDEKGMVDYRLEDRKKWLQYRKQNDPSLKRKRKGGGTETSLTDVDKVRKDLGEVYLSLAPDRGRRDLRTGERKLNLNDATRVRDASYEYAAARDRGAEPRSARAYALAGMLQREGKSLMSFVSPLDRPKKDKGRDSRYQTNQQLQSQSLASFAEGVNRQMLLQREKATRERAIPLMGDGKEEIFFDEVERAVKEAGIPAELAYDDKGDLKFVPAEGFAQTGLDLSFLDKLTTTFFQEMERASREGTSSRKRRAGAR